MADVFEGAGEKPGLQVWRVEKMKLQAVPKEEHGNFYTGDAYVLLHTSAAPSYNVHSWAGSQSSKDEYGAAAIFMMQLDDYLKGAACQYTEYQGEESRTFMGYFKGGIKYKTGGVASGFSHAVTNQADVKRVLHLKGRRYIRATEIELSWGGFNSGDCFIIDLGENIYHWSGSQSNRFERLKTTLVAKGIRDDERGGRSEVIRIMEGEEPEEVINVLGPKPDLPPGTCDKAFHVSKKTKSEAALYKISDAAGPMKATCVAEKNPFKQSMLCPKECFIVDNHGNHKIFVWKGPQANDAERKAALKAAEKFIKDHDYPDKTQIQIMPAGGESTLFKEFFSSWMDKGDVIGYGEVHSVGQIASVERVPFDASSLHDNKAMAAQHGMVDDGSGTVQIWRVDGATRDKVEVDPSTYGQFYGGDCYLVQYSYTSGGKPKDIIYIWQGNQCSQDELGLSAVLTIQLDDSMGGVATQVRVTQGQEPAHLVSVFKGKLMIVYLGGTSRGEVQTVAGDIRLFHIRLSSTRALRAVEVEPTASSLNSNDMFVLKTPAGVTVWKGVGAAEEELEAAEHMAKILGGSETVIQEKSEPDSFWKALGGKTEYQTSRTLVNAVRSPRLFAVSNKTGTLEAEELPPDFSQIDLATDDIMILDVYDQIYVWVGRDANEAEKKGVEQIAKDYINTDPSGRRGVPIVSFKQGQEPPSFTGWFHAWDDGMWDRGIDAFLSR